MSLGHPTIQDRNALFRPLYACYAVGRRRPAIRRERCHAEDVERSAVKAVLWNDPNGEAMRKKTDWIGLLLRANG